MASNQTGGTGTGEKLRFEARSLTITPATGMAILQGRRPYLGKLKSVRVGRFHFEVSRNTPEDFKTINKAKKHSRTLGGAGYVHVASSAEEAKAILREIRS